MTNRKFKKQGYMSSLKLVSINVLNFFWTNICCFSFSVCLFIEGEFSVLICEFLKRQTHVCHANYSFDTDITER